MRQHQTRAGRLRVDLPLVFGQSVELEVSLTDPRLDLVEDSID